jgi:hypothetical protein
MFLDEIANAISGVFEDRSNKKRLQGFLLAAFTIQLQYNFSETLEPD